MAVQLLRPKPSALPPARAALAEAIESLTARRRENAAREETFEKARAAYWQAVDEVDRAKMALAEAPGQAAAHLTASALGDTTTPPQSPQAARAALVAAEENAASKKAVRDAAEKAKNENPPLDLLMDRVNRAAAAVIAESPEMQKLIAEIETAQRRLVEVSRPLALLYSKSVISETRDNYDTPANTIYRKMQAAPFLWPEWHDTASPSALQWAAAWEALMTDATTPLPAAK